MSSKKKSTPKPIPTNVISLDALLGNWPTIELGGVQFEGRHFTQGEKLAYMEAEAARDALAEAGVILRALNARGANVDMDWFNSQPDVFLQALVRGLAGQGWPGDNPK